MEARHELPITYWTFRLALAIAGVPGPAGFQQGRNSGEHLRARACRLRTVGMVTSFLTALYMFRLVFMAFHGTRRDHAHLHDAPPAMAFPLIVLAVGSIAAGYVGVPHILGGANHREHFLAPSFEAPMRSLIAPEAAGVTGITEEPALEWMLMGLASLMALGGIALRPDLPAAARNSRAGRRDISRRVSLPVEQGYVDEVYDEAIVQPIKALSEGACGTVWMPP
jgi:NADH-quinone oxidoreductase subunit L